VRAAQADWTPDDLTDSCLTDSAWARLSLPLAGGTERVFRPHVCFLLSLGFTPSQARGGRV